MKGKAKVKWKMVCSPKENGGLGLKDLRRWNDVLLSKHVWNIVNNKKSLWVKWVYKFYLKERNFWDIQVKKNFCWTWKRILIAGNIVRPHIVSCIGSGENTSLWHDWWHLIGILSMLISRSEWIRAGFNDMSKVKDIFVNGQLCWPTDWLENYPGLMDWPLFVNNEGTEDKIIWRDNNGKCKRFSCKQVWSDVNFFGPKVPWFHTIWFSNNIPRNAFILWMAILGKLKTQDRLLSWEIKGNLFCPLCLKINDSHDHLFFKCDFSKLIWEYFSNKADIRVSYGNWKEFIYKFCEQVKGKSIGVFIKKLVLAGCVSHIWHERNMRFFRNNFRSPFSVTCCIEKEIQLRLLGLKYESKVIKEKVWRCWGIDRNNDVDNGNKDNEV